MPPIKLSEEIGEAVAAARPVVALESTIYSHLGLPTPANEEALTRCLAAIRANGAVPAVTAILDGVARVGLEEGEYERIIGPAIKTAERDLPVAISQKWPYGATTVSASLALCARTAIRVFATGGIGGVHIGAETTGDVSADLGAISRHPVLTVCAGAKAFLDIPRTLEMLETLSAPVLGYQTDDFPMFYSRSSGSPVPVRVETPSEVAAVVAPRIGWSAGGVLLAVPIPADDEIPATDIREALATARRRADAAGIRGAARTPFVLEQIARETEGRNIPANLALAENNAVVAAQVAVELAKLR